VYEQGVLPDGHRFFAMQKLGGQNLASELEAFAAPPDVETIAGTALQGGIKPTFTVGSK
jgi:hypothetical protein